MLVEATIVLAGAFFVPDSGTENRAMGGTGVALNDSPMSVWYNPATLAGQTGVGILVDGNALFMSQTFQRAGTNPDDPGAYPGAGEPYPEVKGNPPLQVIPALVGSYSLLDDRLTVAAGGVAPTGPRQRFAQDGPQRFNLTEQWLVQVNYGVWAGYQITDWIAVGAGVEGLYNIVEQAAIASDAEDQDLPTENPDNDVPLSVEAHSAFTPGAILGVRLTPRRMSGWTFGASFRPAAKITAKGELTSDDPRISQPVPLDLLFAVPALFRVGAGVERDLWSVRGELVVEDWTPHEEILIDFDDESPFVVLEVLPTEQPIVHNYTAAYSARVGGSREVNEKLTAMGGYFFETAAVPSETMGVDSFDNFKHGINAGLSYQLGPVRLSAAYSFVYLQPREIDDSEVEALAPFADDGFVVGNGKYSGFYNMASVSALTRF